MVTTSKQIMLDNNDSNNNSFLTVKEINKMINSPKQPSISDDNNIVKEK